MSKPLNAETAVQGVVLNLSFEEYLARPGLSHSMMKRQHPRPAHFLAESEAAAAEEEKPPKPAFALGTLSHTLVLEPGYILPQIAIRPVGMKFTNAEGKAWRDAQLAQGMTIVEQEEHDAAVAGARAIARHPLADHFLRSGYAEVSYFDTVSTPYGEVVLKARVDFAPTGADVLLDLKTARDASPRGFTQAAADRRYYAQAVHYLDLHNRLNPDDQRNEMLFFVVEKHAPFLVACYTLSADFCHLGRNVIREDIETFARCTATGSWEGYDPNPVTLQPPRWLAQQFL